MLLAMTGPRAPSNRSHATGTAIIDNTKWIEYLVPWSAAYATMMSQWFLINLQTPKNYN